MTDRVVVVGAGIAGLACAVELLRGGRQVTLIEQSRVPGGRARSFFWREAGCDVDTGPHLAMACYRAFRELLGACGRNLPLQRRLRVELRSPGGRRVLICRNAGGLLLSLLTSRGISIWDKLALIRAFRRADELKNTTTVEEWLDATHQPESVRESFWAPFVTAVLNQAPATAPSRRLHTVLRRAFLDRGADARLSVSMETLDQLVVRPAIETIRRLGGEIVLGEPVRSVVGGAVSTDARRIDAGEAVLAVPPDAVAAMLPGFPLPRFEPVPIVSAHLLVSDTASLPPGGFLGLLDSDFHWLFVRDAPNGRLVSLLTSDARKLVALEPGEIERRARETLLRVLPTMPAHAIRAAIAIKDRRATYAGPIAWNRPAVLPPNLHIAGDWTEPDYPGTLEAAALSGLRAAREVLSSGSELRAE